MMKRVFFVAVAICAACLVFAQVKKEKVPPPPPPVVAMKAVPPSPPLPPAPPKPEASKEYKAFLKRNPDVQNIQWVQHTILRIRLKSGKEEIYHMNKKEDVQQLENKYGKLPASPPPPPAPRAPKAPRPIEE